MDQIHEVCRRRHLSKRTEEAYRFWIRQFIFHFNKRHPRELRESDVAQFLNHLAVKREVSASTQTQALNALVFLYRDVLETPLDKMPGFNRIQQYQRIPVVMSPSEVSAVLAQMSGSTALMARLLFGSGLRVEECCTLRIKDIDFASAIVSVRNGKGAKDRTTVLPGSLKADLQAHLCVLHNCMPMTGTEVPGWHPCRVRLTESIRKHLHRLLGNSCFHLRCVAHGVKAVDWPDGMYQLQQSKRHSGRLWHGQES